MLVHVADAVFDPEKAPGPDRLERASMLAFAARTMLRKPAVETLGTVNRLIITELVEHGLRVDDENESPG